LGRLTMPVPVPRPWVFPTGAFALAFAERPIAAPIDARGGVQNIDRVDDTKIVHTI
jgi:hypothetical protein